MNVRVRSINSETDIKDTSAKNFRRYRIVEQTAFYQDDGADIYYNPDKKFSGEAYAFDGIVDMMLSSGVDVGMGDGKKIAVVSLGCGSCEKDVKFVNTLQESLMNVEISFFGVDSSTSMLGRAHDVMQESQRNTQLICADFGSQKFQREFMQMMNGYDMKLICLWGHTMGNLNQSYMIDIFRDFLDDSDYLLIDVIGVQKLSNEHEAKLFDRYERYLSTREELDFFMNPLRQWGIDMECGEVVLDMKKKTSIGALLFTFGFQISEKTQATVRGSSIMLLPGEYIELYNVYVYDIERLSHFFEESGLQVEGIHDNGFLKQLLIRKI